MKRQELIMERIRNETKVEQNSGKGEVERTKGKKGKK